MLLPTACIGEPTFELASHAEAATTPPSGEMVLIPATVLASSAITTSHHKPDHDGGPPKGGDEDGKKPPKPKPPKPDDLKPGEPKPGEPKPGEPEPGGPEADVPAPSEPTPGTTSPTATVVPAFWLDAEETSVAEYEACVAAGACSPAGRDAGCTLGETGRADHPITCVTRAQAAAYCRWRQKRLVRGDEWTAATSGSTGRPYPWGTEAPASDRLNACGDECASPSMGAADPFPKTAPRGAFPGGRSPDGAFDLAGNVAEWLDGEPARVAGGSYLDTEREAIASGATRPIAADASEPTIGFRCARDGPAP